MHPPDPTHSREIEHTIRDLPRDAYYAIVTVLYGALPPTILNTPDALRRRMTSAIAMVAGLVPVNPAQAMLAANWVVATLQAMESHTAAHDPALTWDRRTQCLAQANAMQRNARGLLDQLRRIQTLRMKRDGAQPDADQAAWIEHGITATMETALSDLHDTLLASAPGPDHPTELNPEKRISETNLSKAERAHQAWMALAYGRRDQNTEHRPSDQIHETNLRDDPASPVPPNPADTPPSAKPPAQESARAWTEPNTTSRTGTRPASPAPKVRRVGAAVPPPPDRGARDPSSRGLSGMVPANLAHPATAGT